jgi:predicted ester cyclase
MMRTDAAEPEVLLKRTSTEENAALIRRFYEEIFNRGNLEVVGNLVASRFVDHIPSPLPGQPTQGPEAVKWFASLYRTAFPDLQVSIDELMTVDDRVITRVTWRGTQKGKLLGADPTGKQVRISGIDIARVSGGQLVEHWGQIDVLGMLSQLDFLPGLE